MTRQVVCFIMQVVNKEEVKYMKKLLTGFILLGIVLFLYGCNPTETTDEPTDVTDPTEDTTSGDNIAPLFLDSVAGVLPPLTHKVGEEVDFISSLRVTDNVDQNDVVVTIHDTGGYLATRPGIYVVTIAATDKSGNTALVEKRITVYDVEIATFDAFVIEDAGIEYILNSDTALNYTSSGTAFRLIDKVQVMDKDFFVSQYTEKSVEHTNNGGVPYLPHGVVLLLDQNMSVKHLRIAPNIEIDHTGTITSTNLNWTNSIDAVQGGGNFKNIIQSIEEEIPDGGYVVFTGAAGDQNAKKFLIQNLFSRQYTSGVVSTEHYDINTEQLQIQFIENYEVERKVEEEQDVFGEMIVKDYNYGGIPTTTYYVNDGIKKPVIFFFHGFSGNRTTGIMGRGEKLAELGFYVVALDAHLHGERMPDWFEALSYGERQKEIVNIQIQTAKDAQQLFHQYFKHLDSVDTSEVFAYGVSMGAGSAFYIGKIMEEVSTIVSIVGSPSFYQFYQEKQAFYQWPSDQYYSMNLEYYEEMDPLLHYQEYIGKNIFMGNGLTDTTVPKKFAEEFHSALNQDNVIYKVYDIGHSSTPEMLQDAYNFLLEHKN